MLRVFATAVAAGLIAGCATSPAVPDAARAELAPAGKLRAGMNLSNTLLITRDPASGELRGVSVDLARELGRRLGVPVEFIAYASAGETADAVGAGAWDVAMLAIEPARAERISFSPAMTEIEATYLVSRDSPLKTIAQFDAAGVRIAVNEKSGYDLYLTRTLRNATLVRARGLSGSFDVFTTQRLDALAGLKPTLLPYVEKLPGSRLIEGRFMTVQHGIGTPRERRAGAEYLRKFVEEMNASGFVARSIERHGVRGLSPVKP